MRLKPSPLTSASEENQMSKVLVEDVKSRGRWSPHSLIFGVLCSAPTCSYYMHTSTHKHTCAWAQEHNIRTHANTRQMHIVNVYRVKRTASSFYRKRLLTASINWLVKNIYSFLFLYRNAIFGLCFILYFVCIILHVDHTRITTGLYHTGSCILRVLAAVLSGHGGLKWLGN